jgi:hypothetical protein
MQKEIIIKGAIGNTDRQNRDNMRILGGGCCVHAEKPHRQRPSVGTQKDTKIAGKVNSHQWGVVYFADGCAPCIMARDYKYPTTVIRKWQRK